MIKNKLQIILSLFLIALFPLATTLTFQATGSQNDILFPNITTSGVGNFVEDFTTDTFKDPGTTAWGWGTGTVTNTRNFSWTQLDYFETNDPVVDLDIQGRKIYAGLYNSTVGPDSIITLDISNPSDIKKLGEDSDWIETLSVDVIGDILFTGQVTIIGYSIVLFDVSDPYNIFDPNGVGLLDGYVTDIETNGYLAYFTNYNATGGKSLRILDANDPTSLNLITCDWEVNRSLGLDVQGQMVYVAASDDGFYVLNASNKNTPVETDHLPLAGNVTDVVVDGHIAYVAAGSAGIYTIDVRDPTDISVMGHYDTPGSAIDLVLQGNTLFVADGSGGVQVLDVADPNNPSFVTAQISSPFTYCVDLFGGILVVGTEGGIFTFNICAGLGITNLANYAYLNTFSTFQVWDVRVQGDIAYIAGGSDGLITLNIRDPNNPILLDNDSKGATPFYRKLEVKGDFAYIADYGNAFRVYDISDPTDIKQTDFSGLSYPTDVAVSGDMAWIADGPFGVYYFDISDPFSISYINFFDIFDNVTSLWVQGYNLYVAEWIGGTSASLHTYDISDSMSVTPTLLYSRTRYAYNYDVQVDGDLLYLAGATDGNGMWIYNVSDPTTMTISDYVIRDSYGVWGFGPYVLSADNGQGVSIINATNQNSIFTNSVYSDATSALQVTTSGDYTFVANRSSLVILRHFESAGDTYVAGTKIAQSTKISDDPRRLITSATLNTDHYVPPGTVVEYFMSADGGLHWEAVTPGVAHDFVVIGYDLRWRAEITGPKDRSVHIYEITIDYEFNLAPTEPDLTDPGDTNFLGSVKLKWNESTDADGTIDHYDVEVSDSSSFTTILKNYTTTKTSKGIYPLKPGIYYFRVRAVDDGDAISDWSTADIEVTFNLLGPMWLGIIGGGLLVLIALIVIISVVVRRKKKVSTR